MLKAVCITLGVAVNALPADIELAPNGRGTNFATIDRNVLLQLQQRSGLEPSTIPPTPPSWVDELIKELKNNATAKGNEKGATQKQLDALKALDYNTIGSDLYNVATGNGDATKSIIDITKSISTLIPPPYGPAIGIVTDIIGSIFSLFGGKSSAPAPPPPPTIDQITKAVQDVVDNALAEQEFEHEKTSLLTSNGLLLERWLLVSTQIKENRSQDFFETMDDPANNLCPPNEDSWHAVLLAASNDLQHRLTNLLASGPFDAASRCSVGIITWDNDCWNAMTDSRLQADRYLLASDAYLTASTTSILFLAEVQRGIDKFNGMAPAGWDGNEAQRRYEDMMLVCGYCSADCGFSRAQQDEYPAVPTIMDTAQLLRNTTDAMRNMTICPNLGSGFQGPNRTSCDSSYIDTINNHGDCCSSDNIVFCYDACAEGCTTFQITCPSAACEVWGGMVPTPGTVNVWDSSNTDCGTAGAYCNTDDNPRTGCRWPVFGAGCDWFGADDMCESIFSGCGKWETTQIGRMSQSCSRCKYAAPPTCKAVLTSALRL